MIVSDIVKIEKVKNFDNDYIEQELLKSFNNIIRWALIEVEDYKLTISVSYIYD